MKNLNDWYIQNENPSHWSFDNGLLSMQVQEGNIFGAGSSDVDNIFIYPVSQPNYSAEVTITLEPTLPFEQAGLGIYWDNDNYIKISKEMFMGEPSIVFVVEQNGQPEIKQLSTFEGTTASVKIEKNDGTITAFLECNQKRSWQVIGSAKTLNGQAKGLMLYTFSGSSNTPNFAKFSEFQLMS
ncbi:DUF1349 domain-containing protein [Vibrio sp. 10N.222.51.C8]|jgi:regulation of enolase protein 1 (concanavalin A-like superfamily)|uniref:Beta-xylosidase C-terminal Concanavalin A-like domain-containing protein n=1 Tax=Vibrio lentus TaxID=136468 RepID=A0A2N7IGS3_9VIBR|nr:MULTISPECIES: DUF1349 domain-containing protein [Vibrio]MCC4839851.1 DUF1349 domain-containing protein [Vibrio lentus]PMI12026.1 hypothetical protein BCU51_25870 [Vibrio lentus]PMK32389.1 hypothetical protein BCU02_24675 [Vibrio lentus]PMK42949.1 hypothetical protein BCT99_25530 [Vibrio lentus]PML32131.1 hypothetical protein BCT79_16895 [Vibrio lentus]